MMHLSRITIETLPDNARQLSLSDFWDELGEPSADDLPKAKTVEDFQALLPLSSLSGKANL